MLFCYASIRYKSECSFKDLIMAIQFARIEIVGRSSGGNACCKGAYNARAIIKDEKN